MCNMLIFFCTKHSVLTVLAPLISAISVFCSCPLSHEVGKSPNKLSCPNIPVTKGDIHTTWIGNNNVTSNNSRVAFIVWVWIEDPVYIYVYSHPQKDRTAMYDYFSGMLLFYLVADCYMHISLNRFESF